MGFSGAGEVGFWALMLSRAGAFKILNPQMGSIGGKKRPWALCRAPGPGLFGQLTHPGEKPPKRRWIPILFPPSRKESPLPAPKIIGSLEKTADQVGAPFGNRVNPRGPRRNGAPGIFPLGVRKVRGFFGPRGEAGSGPRSVA